MTSPSSDLSGLKVLVAEDEVLIAMLVEDALDELGCVMAAQCQSVVEAVAAARETDFDVALIDFNLRGGKATELAEVLRELGRPFAIVTGAPADAAGHGEAAILAKPFKVEEVASTLRKLTAG